MAYTSASILTPGLKIVSGNLVFSTADWLAMGLPDLVNLRVAAGGSTAASPSVQLNPPTDLVIGKNQTISQLLSIFHAGESGVAGDNLSVQGAIADGSFVYIGRPGVSRGVRIAGKIQSFGQATYMIPTDFPLDLYEVWVGNAALRSASILVNQARGLFFDSPEVIPNGPVRLFGKNLQFPQKTATARFVEQGTSTSLAGSVVSGFGDKCEVRIICPATLVPGKVYDVYYNNGLRTDQGEVKLPKAVTCIAAGTNPFALSVAWGHRFPQAMADNVYNVKTDSRLTLKAVGDGLTNDQPSIDAALNLASQSANGGVVYLPAGTYILNKPTSGPRLTVRPKTVLRGVGKTQTILKYGAGSDSGGSMMDFAWEGQLLGLQDIGLVNAGAINIVEYGLYSNFGKYQFMKNVSWDIGLGRRLEWVNCKFQYAEGSTFTQGNIFEPNGWSNPLQLDGSRNATWQGNTVVFMTGAIAFNFTSEQSGCQDLVIEDNVFQRDGRATWRNAADGGTHGDLVSHISSVEFSKNALMQRNRYELLYSDGAKKINDCEAIVAEQGANYQPDLDCGTVTGASATTLSDSSKAWSGSFQQNNIPIVVAIVAGTGLGQWRTISSRTATQLTLATAWKVVPDTTSRYSIFAWGTEGWIVKNNTFKDNQRGILLYYNATRDVTIYGNTFTDSGVAVDITPKQDFNYNNTTPSASTARGILPCYDCDVQGNITSDVVGRIGTFMGVHPNQYVVQQLFGNMALGMEFRNNEVVARSPNTQAKVDSNFENGYINSLFIQLAGGSYSNPTGTPAILGSIFQNNKVTNADQAITLNIGARNTLISGMNRVNVANLIKENTAYGVPVSVGTLTEAATI